MFVPDLMAEDAAIINNLLPANSSSSNSIKSKNYLEKKSNGFSLLNNFAQFWFKDIFRQSCHYKLQLNGHLACWPISTEWTDAHKLETSFSWSINGQKWNRRSFTKMSFKRWFVVSIIGFYVITIYFTIIIIVHFLHSIVIIIVCSFLLIFLNYYNCYNYYNCCNYYVWYNWK